MEEPTVSPERAIGWLRRFGYLLDIILVAIASPALEMGVRFIARPTTFGTDLLVTALAQLLNVGAVCFLIHVRGERLAELGLKWPDSWLRTVLTAVMLAAAYFAIVAVSEHLGYRRNLSAFGAVRGNAALTLMAVLYSFVAAGFTEEFMFRGFLLHRLAGLFRFGRGAWMVAVVVQGMLFGLAHAYQNPVGIFLTGGFGIAAGFVFLTLGRNLWPLIIGHGLYDAARFILFYFYGPPTS